MFPNPMNPIGSSYSSQKLSNIIIWQGKSERSDWFFLGRNFAIQTVSMVTVINCIFFFSKAGKFKTSMAQVPYNKLLTNLASLSHTGEYWPLVIFCMDLAVLSPYCHDLGPIFPVWPSCSVSKRLIKTKDVIISDAIDNKKKLQQKSFLIFFLQIENPKGFIS